MGDPIFGKNELGKGEIFLAEREVPGWPLPLAAA
jgi:hypothetical protein